MSEPIVAPPIPAEPVGPWVPSPHLRSQLLLGLASLAVAAVLASAGSALQFTQPKETGFTLATALGLASFLPRIGVLIAYLGLARETGSDGLKRTSIGLFGAEGIFQLLGLADDAILSPDGVTVVHSVAGLAGLGVILYCFWPFFKAGGFLSVALVWLLLRVVRRLPSWIPVLKQLDGKTQAILVAFMLGLLFLLALQVWFGIALIRLRERLGPMAAVAGWGHLLGVVAFLGLFAWLIFAIVTTASQPGVGEQDFEELFAPHWRWMIGVGAAGELLGALLTALLFQAARTRGQGETVST